MDIFPDPGGAGHVEDFQFLSVPYNRRRARMSVCPRHLYHSILLNSQLLKARVWDDGCGIRYFWILFGYFLDTFWIPLGYFQDNFKLCLGYFWPMFRITPFGYHSFLYGYFGILFRYFWDKFSLLLGYF